MTVGAEDEDAVSASAGGLLPLSLRQGLRRLSRWGLAAVVVLAPLAAGGTRTEVRLGLAGLALAALLFAALGASRRGLRLPGVIWPWLALTFLIALQLVPLPAGLVASLSPDAAAVRDRVLADLGGWPATAPLSLDPSATLRALFDQLAFMAVLVVALNLDRDRRRPFVALLVTLGIGVAVIAAAHWALELPRLYGVLTPLDRHALQGFSAPFINPNHAAGLLVLTTGAALGLLTDAEHAANARLGLLGVTAGLIGVPLTGARGGLVALILMFGLFALQAFARPPGGHLETPRRRARTVSRVALVLGALAAGAAVLLMPDWRHTGAGVTEEVRFRLWRGAVEHLKAFWLTGSGRGSFVAVHPRFQSVNLEGTVTHPENHLLQLGTEVGVIGLVLGVGGALWLWYRCRRGVARQADPLHWGLLAALAALGAQQLLDFGLETQGLALPIALTLGLVVGRGQPPRRSAEGVRPPRPRAAMGVAILALAALAGLVVTAAPIRHHGPRGEIAAIVAAPTDQVSAVAAAALARHPAHYLVALAGAGRLAADPAVPLPTVIAWLNKAMFLGPTDARAHLLAARRFVEAAAPAQAASEYRVALAIAPWRRTVVVAELARALRSPRHLAQAVPPTALMRQTLGEVLISLDPSRARAVVDHLLQVVAAEDLLAEAPARPDLTPDGLTTGLTLRQVRARACLELGDLPCAAADIEALAQGGAEGLAWALRAQYALARGRPDEARMALAAGQTAGAQDAPFLRTVAVVSLRLGDVEAARVAAEKLWRKVAHDPRQASTTLALQARIEERAGDDERALRAWQRALVADPSVAHALAGAARAEALGRPAEARRMARVGLDHWPDEPRLLALVRRLDRPEPLQGPASTPATTPETAPASAAVSQPGSGPAAVPSSPPGAADGAPP